MAKEKSTPKKDEKVNFVVIIGEIALVLGFLFFLFQNIALVNYKTYDECIDLFSSKSTCLQQSYDWCVDQVSDPEYCAEYRGCLELKGTDNEFLPIYFEFN